MRADGCPSRPTVARANAVGSGRHSAPTRRAASSSAAKRTIGSGVGSSNDGATPALATVAVEQAAERAEHAALFAPPAAGARCRSDDAVGEPGEWQRLEHDAARSGQLDEEQPFATEQRRLDPRHHLDV